MRAAATEFMEYFHDWQTVLSAGPIARRYIRHLRGLRKRCAVATKENAVILVPVCPTWSVQHALAELVSRYAREAQAKVVWFDFSNGKRDRLVMAFCRALGWKPGLQRPFSDEIEKRADARARQIFERLCAKADVSAIREDGVLLGDLVYDTFLRDLALPTVDIQDPRLLGYIRDALAILYTSQDYLQAHRVRAVFADHLVYIWQGVLLRAAMAQGIPLYTVFLDPPSAHRIDVVARASGLDIPSRYSYWLYPEIFRSLPPAEQDEALAAGRDYLEQRVSGALHQRVLPGGSAYGSTRQPRVLKESEKPKILVLLHDFCDAVHVFRSLLFDDFYEWINFLLSEASHTDFEWYIKPHPNTNDYRRRRLQTTNESVIESLKEKYPQAVFVDSAVSNRQLVEEGISSVFTMYGTAAHEFPYLGVPVVSGADNPHVAYNFSFTPSNIIEYKNLIRCANNLGPVGAKDQISEFAYMYYLYAARYLGASVPLFRPTPGPREKRDAVLSSALAAAPFNRAGLDGYVAGLYTGAVPSCVK